MVDTQNAHKRPENQTRRESGEVKANEAHRLLNDPAYVAGFKRVRDALIYELENLKHDGMPETDAYERELCRTLRTLTSTKRAMSLGIQGQALREADFRPRKPEDD
jgi:hypothetical protein